MHYFPVWLIFHPSWVTRIKRIFPFDSGAFEGDFYRSYLHKNMNLTDFGLDADITTPGKVISLFFGSVSAYLKGDPASTSRIDSAEFEAQSYQALINAKDANSIDSRGSGIELQTSDAAPLDGALAAVIMPATFADGPMGNRLSSLKIDILPYSVHARMRPNEYVSSISTICLNYYVRIGLINQRDI